MTELPMPPVTDLDHLKQLLREFAAARDWEQFHSPKNLSMALAVEASELLECFQWIDEQASYTLDARTRAAAVEELADVLLYLVRLADRLDVDLLAAAARKLEINDERYPAAIVRGKADKYSSY